jgi:hypothetical protein
MSKAFASLLARRFAPLDFSTVPGFPHPVPSIDIWGDHLPRFAEKKGDNPSDHLIRFHQCMIQLDINHEDVLMKMFVFSLEGDAREWYRSLPPSSISSLKEFHTVFHHRCERFFAREILLEGCCEEFHSHIQNVYSSSCEHEILSIVVVQEEDLHNTNDYNENYISVDASDLISVAHAAFDLYEESVIKEDCSQIFKEVSYDSFSPITDEKDLKMACFSLLDTKVSCSPIFDKYADEADQILTSDFADLKSSPPIYNSYEFDVDEEQYCEKISHLETPAAYIEKSSTEINSFACTILEHRSADNNKQFIINNAVSLQPCSDLHAVEGGSYSRKKGMQRSSDDQSKQQEEVFSYSVIDPFANYLEFSSSINVKLLLSNEGWFCCPFKLHFCMLWFLIFFESRSSMISVDQFLTWLHWKSSFT